MAKVIMTITVDWEGEELKPADLQAMWILNGELDVLARGFKKPVPMTHFICPAYFSRTDVTDTRNLMAQQILNSGAIRAGDEIGVHIHCWKSLAMEAQVPDDDILDAPTGSTFNPTPNIERKGKFVGIDTGYTVPLGIYSQANVKLLLDKSIELLQQYFPNNPLHSYRTGMWVTCDVIFDALRNTPLTIDASALPYKYSGGTMLDWARSLNKSRPMLGWLAQIWGASQVPKGDSYLQNSQSFAQYGTGILGINDGITISQPKKINGITEIPDTGALLPLTNLSYMYPHVESAFDLAESTGGDVYMSIGFHQEGCAGAAFFSMPDHVPTRSEKEGRLAAILRSAYRAISLSKSKNIDLEFLTIKQAADLVGL